MAGWSWECLDDWGPYSRITLPSIVMIFIYWFYQEVGTVLAGLYDVVNRYSWHYTVSQKTSRIWLAIILTHMNGF